MAGDQPIQPSGEPFTWERCLCGAGLWRRYEDRLEMIISPRGGQKRTLRVALAAVSAIKVTCEKCGAETVLHD